MRNEDRIVAIRSALAARYAWATNLSTGKRVKVQHRLRGYRRARLVRELSKLEREEALKEAAEAKT